MVGMAVAPTIHAATIQVASIGIPDTLFLMLLALVVFGPRRLPEIGRQIGKLMYEFRKVSNDFKFQMEEELRASEEAERLEKMRAALPPPAPVVQAEPVLELTATSEAVPVAEAESESVPGEVRGEPRKFPPTIPTIAPPATGETIAAQKPFRGRAPEPESVEETVAEVVETPQTPLGAEEEEVRHG